MTGLAEEEQIQEEEQGVEPAAFQEGYLRRLPIYLLLDTSGSMSGAPINALETGLDQLSRALKKDQNAVEVGFLSVITFDSDVDVKNTLTEVGSFSPPETLGTGGGTSMGEAFKTLGDRMESELEEKRADEHPGDHRPIVFLLTDGRPNDSNWEQKVDSFQKTYWGKNANVIGVGCGPSVNEQDLRKVSDVTLIAPDLNEERIGDFVKLVSAITKSASETASRPGDAGDSVQDVAVDSVPDAFRVKI